MKALVLALVLAAVPTLAQHAHHSPYAGLEQREVKALSEQQIADLRSGKGMGLAMAAELNGYPGPMHVLELDEKLGLSPEQRQRTEALFAQMRREAISLGDEIVARETALDRAKLIYPLFVRHGRGLREEIAAMPGQYRFSVDRLVEEVGAARQDGVRAVLLFGIPERKDDQGSEAWSDEGAVQVAVRQLKREYPDVIVITDVCLCEYTSHGHCGLIEGGDVANDPTLELLARAALKRAVVPAPPQRD